MSEPSHAAPIPQAPADRLRDADGLVVGLDFDGTLAPIAGHADQPEIEPANREALHELVVHEDATPAVVSGRSLADLQSKVDVDGVLYAGNHGLELATADREEDPPADQSVDRPEEDLVTDRPDVDVYRPAIEDACAAIEEQVGDVAGCEVEDKRLTATIHYRRTPAEREEAVREAVEGAVEDVEELRLRPAKQALEIRPAVEWHKGSVVGRLAESAPEGWRTVYVGDDVTDEDAFEALGPDDLGIRVGGYEQTAADYGLPDQEATAGFLRWLLEDPLAEG